MAQRIELVTLTGVVATLIGLSSVARSDSIERISGFIISNSNHGVFNISGNPTGEFSLQDRRFRLLGVDVDGAHLQTATFNIPVVCTVEGEVSTVGFGAIEIARCTIDEGADLSIYLIQNDVVRSVICAEITARSRTCS